MFTRSVRGIFAPHFHMQLNKSVAFTYYSNNVSMFAYISLASRRLYTQNIIQYNKTIYYKFSMWAIEFILKLCARYVCTIYNIF